MTGRVVVVTGAASGIGFALARRFAAEGDRVVLADLHADVLAEAAQELEAGGAEVLAVPTDVSDPEAVDALAARAVERFGTVHVVCNNAGTRRRRRRVGGAAGRLAPPDGREPLGRHPRHPVVRADPARPRRAGPRGQHRVDGGRHRRSPGSARTSRASTRCSG